MAQLQDAAANADVTGPNAQQTGSRRALTLLHATQTYKRLDKTLSDPPLRFMLLL